jgi:hypothetical protein
MIARGGVFDATGTPATALIRMRSLDPRIPYAAEALAVNGAWVINNFPEGARIELAAEVPGHAPVVREFDAGLRRGPCGGVLPYVINFGGPPSADDPAGAAFHVGTCPSAPPAPPDAASPAFVPADRAVRLRLGSGRLCEGATATVAVTGAKRSRYGNVEAYLVEGAWAGSTQVPTFHPGFIGRAVAGGQPDERGEVELTWTIPPARSAGPHAVLVWVLLRRHDGVQELRRTDPWRCD